VSRSGGLRCLPESLRDERREKVVCHQHRGGDIVRGVAYIMKSKGPRTEP